jgi:restriction system protein
MTRADKYPPPKLTPAEFELEVKQMLDATGLDLKDFQTVHQELVQGVDGDYAIDVTARFSALEVDFLVLVECKYYKENIKRDTVLELHSKIQSTGAQKGILFSTSGFQSGAIEFAKAHGIALIQVSDGRTMMLAKAQSFDPDSHLARPVAGWLHQDSSIGLVSWDFGDYLREFLSGK